MTKDNELERMFSEEDVKGIIAHAEALKSVDAIGRAQKAGSLYLGEGTSVQHLYEIAQEIDIPRSYIDRAMATRYPSPKEMREQLDEIGAKPQSDLVERVYRKSLKAALENTFPSERFRAGGDLKQNIFYRDFINPDRIFFKDDTKELARLSFYNGKTIILDIYSPMFVTACGSTLNRLNERFGVKNHHESPTFHYNAFSEEEFL